MIKRLFRDTKGNPYFVQLYCKVILDNYNQKIITENDYQSIKPEIIDELEDFFNLRLDTLSYEEKELLSDISNLKSKDITLSQIEGKCEENKEHILKILKNLEEKSMIYREEDHDKKTRFYRFSIPLFREFLIHKHEKQVKSSIFDEFDPVSKPSWDMKSHQPFFDTDYKGSEVDD